MPTEDFHQETAADAQTESIDENLLEANAEESVHALTPGEVLQAERLRQNLTEKQVADELHITMHYVRAIESNKFEKLPGAVFAKGYIKNYALFLQLDVSEVAALFDGINSKQQEKKDEANRQLIARRRSDRNKPWVYASVACFIVGFAALWAYNHYSNNDNEPERAAPGTQSSTTATVATIASRPIAQTPAVSTSAPQAITPAVAEPVPGTVINAVPSVSETADNAANILTVLSTLATQPAAAIGAGDQSVAATLVTELTADGPQVIKLGVAGNDILRITFSGESWVEVNDSNSQQIYRDIRAAGDVLEITGDAPFSILLGDAPFTSMSLNGAEIDVSDNIRIDNSARLTVGL